MDILDSVSLGLATALQFENLLYCVIGVVLGTVLGVIPGIGIMSSISLLFPLTFYLEPTAGLIMLAGIWYGTSYGGSTASILLNIPGTAVNAVTCLDGYPMARQGRAGVALLMTTLASLVGGSIGILLLMFFAPVIAEYALLLGPRDFFAIILLGLVAASAISEGSALKGLAMVVAGMMIGTIGIDLFTGAPRNTLGFFELTSGVSIVALAMGMFGAAEIISSVRNVNAEDVDRESVKLKNMIPTRDDVRRSWFPMFRGSAIGSFFGALPGTGSTIAAFLSYVVEKRVSAEPERFGKGAIEGIMAPEAANNAADQTAFIPTLALGIPGSPTMALMLGVLIIHGITPGPGLIDNEPALFWGLVMSFWIGNILLVILNAPLVTVWVRLLMVPYGILFPAVLVFICVGTYYVGYSTFDLWVVMAFGLIGYLMRILRFSPAPLLLGFVLGPMVEEHFRRAMLIGRGDFATFLQSPVSAIALLMTAVLLVWSVYDAMRR